MTEGIKVKGKVHTMTINTSIHNDQKQMPNKYCTINSTAYKTSRLQASYMITERCMTSKRVENEWR